MKKHLRFCAALLLLSGLAACNLPFDRLGILSAASPLPPTPALEEDPTGAPPEGSRLVAEVIAEATPETPQPAAPAGECNRAAPGRPLDLTIPDGEVMRPGQPFSKTWRLVNAGACEWTSAYAVVLFSGERMSASGTQFLRESVAPGGSVDITVDMLAPLKPGVYQSNWMLSDENANLFGIGPTGSSAFWVRIEVVEVVSSPSPEALPSSTVTPAVFYGGELTLYLQDWMDLDSGMINTGATDDLSFQLEGEKAFLRPAAGTRIAVFGARTPTEVDCTGLRLSADPLALDSLKEGIFLCYRSNQGLPGYARLPVIDLQDNFIKLEFLTWSAP